MSTTAVTTTTTAVPGYRAAVWDIDPVHSDVSFTVRHMMISKVRGHFTGVSGRIVTGADITQSSVTADIDVSTFDTGNTQRDDHVRSADFLHAEQHPTISFRSTAVRADGEDYVLDGQLTLKGVTRPVSLGLELTGFGPDPYGGYRAGFSASTKINRRDYGVDITLPLDGGGVVVGDQVTITLDIQAVQAV